MLVEINIMTRDINVVEGVFCSDVGVLKGILVRKTPGTIWVNTFILLSHIHKE